MTNSLDTETRLEVQILQRDLINAEAEVSRIKRLLAHYGVMPYETPLSIHWRNSVRKCLTGDGTKEYLMSSNQIVDCVCYVNNVEADRNIKTKVSTTLSTMFSEGEIGRVPKIDNEREYLYGIKTYFEDDLKTLKEEYQHLVL